MRLTLLTLALALTLPLAAAAQFGGGLGDTSPFTLDVTPQYLSPYSRAVISVQSSSLDLTNATMTVSVADKKTYEGNVQPTSVTLGGAGSATSVKVIIVSDGKTFTQTASIRPQDVALILEPVSSVPPLYKGKSLVPLEGGVRVVAVANLRNASGVALDPITLAYSWTVDDTKITSSSGIGRSSLVVASPLQYRARTVSVAVSSQDGALVGGNSVSLSPQEPSMRLYENDPLFGIRFDRALSSTYAIKGTEATLYAAPFSFPITSGAPLLQWFVNGSAAQTGSLITLRPSGDGEGSASLSVTASSGDRTTTNTNILVTFGAKPSSNFFGL